MDEWMMDGWMDISTGDAWNLTVGINCLFK
jgi:hypothetical protein